MEIEKKKRKHKVEPNGKRRKPIEDTAAVAPPPPGDEEVEEFFAILKRIHVALQYFRRRDGELTAKSSWSPSFEREDFDGVKKDQECSPEYDEKKGLDLNSDPVSDSV